MSAAPSPEALQERRLVTVLVVGDSALSPEETVAEVMKSLIARPPSR